ncbi:golgin subfamily A member 6-like protein 4 [Bacillus rossius redtenbacheri]|uniref:golgin subfamily A member 6-like protein 4 n=1 Tax=Bacillus rossius redtenbacheri TaxID=93214 RepID=UPI002FDCF625
MEEVLERQKHALCRRQDCLRKRQNIQDQLEQRLVETARELQAQEVEWSGHDWVHADSHYDISNMSPCTALRLHVATEWQNRLLDMHFSLERREAAIESHRSRADKAEHILDEWEKLVDEERRALRGEVCEDALFNLDHCLESRERLMWQRDQVLKELEASVRRRQAIAEARQNRLEQEDQEEPEEDVWLLKLEKGLFEQEKVAMERQKSYILLSASRAIRDTTSEIRQQASPGSDPPH